ncbi:MAG: MFS transporter, partial [Lentihominibacter sp.]|nr:MFS transporter [Lentihominibacter sp.]
LYLFIVLIGTATVTYWQVMPAMIYDVCEYDQLETGMQRQGTIVSIQGLVEAISSGIGAQILGLILQFAGFNSDAAAQSAHTMEWIENCTTFIPAIFLFLSCVALWKYPITKKVYEDICRKLEDSKSSR